MLSFPLFPIYDIDNSEHDPAPGWAEPDPEPGWAEPDPEPGWAEGEFGSNTKYFIVKSKNIWEIRTYITTNKYWEKKGGRGTFLAGKVMVL